MTNEEIEAEAIRIHNESEKTQKQIFDGKGYHSKYTILTWDQIIEGFYKERVRLLAKEKLETSPPKKKKVKKKNA